MNSIYATSSRALDAALEVLVRSRLHSDELVYQWSDDIDQGLVSVCLIQVDVLEEHAEVTQTMCGLCAGGGRLWSFKRTPEGWSFANESEWVS